jgi:hypothetical protein
MSWDSEIMMMVRTLINDLNTPYEFSDDRIKQVITVAGKYVKFDVNLSNTYTIDVVNPEISPDPTSLNDDFFISLVSLKAACIIDQGTYRTKAALEGIRTALGPANISIAGSMSGWQGIIDNGACGLYQEISHNWDIKNATAIRAILSPFVGNKFDPRYLMRGPIRDRTNNDFYS